MSYEEKFESEYLSELPDTACPTAHTSLPSDAKIDLSKSQMWAISGNGSDYFPCESTVTALPAGQYLIRHSESRGFYFTQKSVMLDDLIELPDNNSVKVIDSIRDFWSKEQAFRDLGFLWKRGIILCGPPGGGKTSTVQQLAKLIVDMGGISIYCTYPRHEAEGLRILRTIEPNRPIVVIIEDIDAIIRQHGESELLAMLDGELQIDNIVFIATTNYPEKLDKRIINRPSRFDEVIQIDMPNDDCRRTYLKHKNPNLSESNLDEWVKKTLGFSIAHIKELIVSVECLGNDVDESVIRLRNMIDYPISSEDNNRKIGLS